MASRPSATELRPQALAQAELERQLGFSFSIARSARRRTVAIEIRRAQVVVRAPLGVADTYLIAFLQAKAAWVNAKLSDQQVQQEQLAAQLPPPTWAAGSQLPFMDEALTLVLGRGTSAAIQRVDKQLHVILSTRSKQPVAEQIRVLLARWYQQQALQLLSLKTQALCRAMGLRCTQVSVKATRSKWGHCTSAGAIQYNWQILLAPEGIVDYLVAHEVSHLRHPNHSAAFWALVESVCSGCKTRRAWLKAHSAALIL
jgi:predicted metal-dependent hydrolase